MLNLKQILHVFIILLFSIYDELYAGDMINFWGLGSKYVNNPALGFHVITFIIFIVIVCVVGKKTLYNYLSMRRNNIKRLVLESSELKTKADYSETLYKKKLNNLDYDIDKLHNEFVENCNVIKKNMNNETKRMKLSIEKEGESAIKARFIQSRLYLINKTIKLVVSLSHNNLINNKTNIDNEDYLKTFLVQLSKEKIDGFKCNS